MSQPLRTPEPPQKLPPNVPQRVREYVAGLFERPGLRPEDAGVLRRLTGNDSRMRDAWTRLARIARTDEDYVLFVLAAWWARDDYGEWRERTRQAGELAGRIAELARELAGLLRRIEQTHTRLPHEFTSLRALLWRSPSAQREPYDSVWRVVRQEICGPDWLNEDGSPTDTPPSGSLEIDDRLQEGGTFTIRCRDENDDDNMNEEEKRKEQRQHALSYAWEKAPDVRRVLLTLARAAENYTPHPGADYLAAATAAQKPNKVTEYIRGFARLLLENGLTVTPPMRTIMALAGAVVLELEDLTPETVRKALNGRFQPDL